MYGTGNSYDYYGNERMTINVKKYSACISISTIFKTS